MCIIAVMMFKVGEKLVGVLSMDKSSDVPC